MGRDQRGGITAEITIPLEFNMDFVLSTDVEKFQSKTQMSTSGFCTGKSLGMNNVIKSHLLGTINICTKLNVDGSHRCCSPSHISVWTKLAFSNLQATGVHDMNQASSATHLSFEAIV